ncbi:MAG: hypothetical protein RIE08_02430 [Acidimicrobiales bacterium]
MADQIDLVIDEAVKIQLEELITTDAVQNFPLFELILRWPDRDEVFRTAAALLSAARKERRLVGLRILREIDTQRDSAAQLVLTALDVSAEADELAIHLSAVAWLGTAEAVKPTIVLVDHPDPGVRHAMTEVLSFCSPTPMPGEVRDALIVLSADPVERIRFSAVFEIRSWIESRGLGGDEVLTAMRARLEDEDEDVRRTAHEAVAQLETNGAS